MTVCCTAYCSGGKLRQLGLKLGADESVHASAALFVFEREDARSLVQAGNEIAYLNQLVERLPNPDVRFHFCGSVLREMEPSELPERIYVYRDIPALIKAVNSNR